MTAMRAQLPDRARLYTVDQFEKLPEFNDRYELLDGRPMKKPLPSGKHSYIALNLILNYYTFDPAKQLGLLMHEASVKLSLKSAPIPDLSFWKAERGVKPGDTAMPLPDLAVEIHSPSDLRGKVTLASAMVKVHNLLGAGVPIVWVIYPDRQIVEVYHGQQDFQAGPVQTLGLADELSGEDVIPGFRLAVRKLFE